MIYSYKEEDPLHKKPLSFKNREQKVNLKVGNFPLPFVLSFLYC
jgi:hypothetical protein